MFIADKIASLTQSSNHFFVSRYFLAYIFWPLLNALGILVKGGVCVCSYRLVGVGVLRNIFQRVAICGKFRYYFVFGCMFSFVVVLFMAGSFGV